MNKIGRSIDGIYTPSGRISEILATGKLLANKLKVGERVSESVKYDFFALLVNVSDQIYSTF